MTLLQSFLDCLSPIRIWIIGVIQLSFVVLEGNKSWRWLTILQFRNEIKKFWPEAFRPSHTNMLQNEGPQEMNDKKYTPLLFCCGFHEIMSHNIWKQIRKSRHRCDVSAGSCRKSNCSRIYGTATTRCCSTEILIVVLWCDLRSKNNNKQKLWM